MRAVRFTRISNWWTLALLILVVLASKLPGFAQAKKPNIIILMTDDVGWMDLGVYGGGADRGAPTPNMDRIAAEGMRFTQYYAQPTCTLGRLAVMIGREPVRAGILNVFIPRRPQRDQQVRHHPASVSEEGRLPYHADGQVAPRRQGAVLSHPTRVRRDALHVAVLRQRVYLRRYQLLSRFPQQRSAVHGLLGQNESQDVGAESRGQGCHRHARRP